MLMMLDAIQSVLLLYPSRHARGGYAAHRLHPTPYFGTEEAPAITKEPANRFGPLARTIGEKFVRCRCISAELHTTEELNGIRAEKPLRERSIITSLAVGAWSLFDR